MLQKTRFVNNIEKTYLKKLLIYLFQKKEFEKLLDGYFSEKRNVLQKADEEFLNILENIDMDRPRYVDFMTHSDRFYLSVRLSCMDKAIKEIKNIKRHQQIQKRKASIKLVRINNK